MLLQRIVNQYITKSHPYSFIITGKSNNFIAGFWCCSHKNTKKHNMPLPILLLYSV